ncbi:hypothetical protein BDA96_10G276900 [Sorghum bicolor]|jgi:hypothetical protein|uniref:Uncharacterized protein n=2 Tax=Sorghum bicolor TaxID=4558 RepID=A0A921Q5Q7_SORBI|nr:hypothetical protein BDA96_10G276900 [Sorghum bicolor]KXG20511.1 hypothetical protein SORBI_3010G212900 [Sorghum bicolor]
MGDETKRSSSTVTVAVLVLASCHAALAVSNLSAPHDDDPAASRGVEPVGYLASMVSTVVAAYVASAACGAWGRRRRLLRVEGLLAEARRTWARPAATALYIELLTTAMASLLLTLRAFLGAAGGAAVGLLTASGSVALVGWLAPVLFAHSDIACRMSLVVAVVEEEEDERYAGRAAVHRAEALVAGRSRVRGFAVGLAAAAIEQVPAWLCGDGAPALVLAPAVLAAKIAACCACAAFYYDCRRRHDGRVGDGGGGGALKLDEGTSSKCCEIDDAWDMADECEAEEHWSAFACLRLT